MSQMKHGFVLALIAVLFVLGGCSGAQFINAVTSDRGYTQTSGVAFGDHGLQLDVYAPDGVVNAPVVVFFYGGSWQAGDSRNRASYKFAGQALAAAGYVAVIPDYRLYPQVKYPDFLADCAQAVKWAHDNAAAYGGSPAKLVVMGHSAGAYNAAMLALDPDYLKAAGGDRAWLRGMVGLAGPYDFLPLTDPVLQTIFGPREQWPQTQPINHVDGHGPPLLLMAGDNDDVVYVKNTNNLYDRIQASGGKAERVTYPSMSHIKIIALMSARLPGHAELMGHVTDFVGRVTAD
ncbi:alpha/beta hydrolase [Nevskia soli]|uniref:alpha/beta hydrolase n=1 Tax=Nevskia soli TaxID=418856 RepID=UPI00055B74A8|nr:alpha/beta hydrolase [Nevskia soli]